MPSQTFTADAIALAPRDEVWPALDRSETWEGISGIDRVIDPKVDEEGRLRGFGFETLVGGRPYLGVARPGAREEGRLMTWNIENPEVKGSVTVDLSDAPGGTRVMIRLHVESKGMLSTMFFPVIAGAIGNGLPEAVADFAAGLGGSGDQTVTS